jgi:hypothetical protein
VREFENENIKKVKVKKNKNNGRAQNNPCTVLVSGSMSTSKKAGRVGRPGIVDLVATGEGVRIGIAGAKSGLTWRQQAGRETQHRH